jgi:hypothetical protein
MNRSSVFADSKANCLPHTTAEDPLADAPVTMMSRARGHELHGKIIDDRERSRIKA